MLDRSDKLATRRLGQESQRDDKKDADDPLADLPFWLEDFTYNLRNVHRSACSRTHFSGFRFGTSNESGTQGALHFYSLPARPKLRRLLENKVLNEGGESRDNHGYAVVVQDLAT